MAKRASITRPLKVIAPPAATSTAERLRGRSLTEDGRVADVVPMDTDSGLPPSPNVQSQTLKTPRCCTPMAHAVREHKADLAFGFDGDGDRCGVVDDEGEEIFADKIGLMLARDLAPLHPGATFVVDVKSTGLYATDPILAEHGCKVVYRKTGHSYIKRKSAGLKALAGFREERPLLHERRTGLRLRPRPDRRGRRPGHAGPQSGREVCRTWKKALPVAFTSLTMSPHCGDEVKYGVVDDVVKEYQDLLAAGGSILGRKITEVITVNGVRVHLEDGSWVLVRASPNKPEVVVSGPKASSPKTTCARSSAKRSNRA
ncbi:hypothetical protein ACRAWD_22185 [Caulobacter segnis]